MMFNVVRINPVAVPHASSPLFLLNWCLSLSVNSQTCPDLPSLVYSAHKSQEWWPIQRKPKAARFNGISTGQRMGETTLDKLSLHPWRMWNSMWIFKGCPLSVPKTLELANTCRSLSCLGCNGCYCHGCLLHSHPWGSRMPSSKKKRACQVPQLDVQWFSVVKLQGIHMHIINIHMYHMQIYSPKCAWYFLM